MEHLHDFITIDTWLEKSLIITFLQIYQFFAHHLEIIQEALLAHLIFASDISLAKSHQIIDVIASIIQQTSNSTICYLFISNHNRTHVEFYQLLYIFHLRIHRQFHTSEDVRNHLGTNDIMAMEGPTDAIIPSFALRFADIMEECRPTKPEIIRMLTYIFQHLHRMVVIVLMRSSITRFHLIHRNKFRQDQIEKSRILQIIKSTARMLGEHNLVHLITNTLTADNLQAFGIAGKSIIGLILYLKIELSSKTHTAHHAEWIIREGNIRIKRSGYNTILHIVNTIERIYEFTKSVFVQTDSHGIDGEIAPVLIIFQGTVFHNRLSGIMVITLLTGTDKLHFHIIILHLSCSEISEHRKMRLLSKYFFQSRSHLDTAAHNNDINIIGRSLQEKITHISTNYITFHSQRIRHL